MAARGSSDSGPSGFTGSMHRRKPFSVELGSRSVWSSVALPPPRGLLEEASPTKAARGQPTEQVPAECTDSYPGAVTTGLERVWHPGEEWVGRNSPCSATPRGEATLRGSEQLDYSVTRLRAGQGGDGSGRVGDPGWERVEG